MKHKENRQRQSRGAVPTAGRRTAAAKACRAETAKGVPPEYVLRLFVSGFTPRSQRAIDNLQEICEGYLAGRYRIDVVDLRQSPGSATDEQIVATPTLIMDRPPPPRRLIGDLSRMEKVLHVLDIK
jgi:circadian clock protein KaiB